MTSYDSEEDSDQIHEMSQEDELDLSMATISYNLYKLKEQVDQVNNSISRQNIIIAILTVFVVGAKIISFFSGSPKVK